MIGKVKQLGPLFAAVAALVGMVLFAFAGIYTFRAQSDVDGKLCEITVQNRMSQRATWVAVRQVLIEGIPETDSEEEQLESREQINGFIDAVLRPIPPLQCVDNQPVPKEE